MKQREQYGKNTMLVEARETSSLESSGQKYRKEILPLVEDVLARRLGARVNEHHRAIREMDTQVMPQIQYTDKVADESVVVQRKVSPRTTETKHIFKLTVHICNQRIFKLVDLAQEIIGVKVAPKTWHKLLEGASTKEAVADDTANSNTCITSRVNQTTLRDFSDNLEEPPPTENESIDKCSTLIAAQQSSAPKAEGASPTKKLDRPCSRTH